MAGNLKHGPRAIFASVFPFGVFGMVLAGRTRRAKLVMLLVILAAVLFSVNCGTNGAKTTVPPGTYQVSVTGASSGANALSHSTTITLTVK